MSAVAACWLAAAVLFLVVLLLVAGGLCRVGGAVSRAEETRGRVWDFEEEEWVDPPAEPGPKQMTPQQIADADDLELLYLSRAYDRAAAALDEGMERIFGQLGPPPADPALEAGLERLYDAVRDNANTPEGEA